MNIQIVSYKRMNHDICLRVICSGNSYLVPERKLENFVKFKEGDNFNHRNTLKYFED